MMRSYSLPLIMLLICMQFCRAQGTAFSYQGVLNDGGSHANGNYDLAFSIFDASSAGNQLGDLLTNSPTIVSNGLFTATLNFGNQFSGADVWLEIAVRTNGSITPYTTLQPRQQITPTPYAIRANTASELSGTINSSQLNNNSITITAGTGLSGGGNVALGNSVSLANAGIIAVNGNSDISASTANGVVTLGTTATTNNIPNAIVKRDSQGGFSSASISVAGTISPAAINLNGSLLLTESMQ